VLATFVAPDARFTSFPTQHEKYLVLVRSTLPAFDPGGDDSEAEVNERLARFHEDTAGRRRSLVDLGFMRRDRDGGRYWLVAPGEGAAATT
jgi:hypothetical protein